MNPLGVYVHWPFCKSKCPYCDFNSHVRDGVEQVRWRDALLKELEHAAREAPGRRLETIFFGGGTPSLMAPETVAAVIARTKALWDHAREIEITLEANPTSVEAGRFAALAEAGVNRVSLGVQALDAAALKFLGREHSADEAFEALDTARRHFARFSFDRIYARPGQTPEAWAGELEQALALAGEHLSLYQLTIERGTRFFTDHARGAFVLPGEEESAAMFEAERPDAGAGVEDQPAAAGGNFEARGITAVTRVFRAGTGNRAAHAPESDFQTIGQGLDTPLPHRPQSPRAGGSRQPRPPTRRKAGPVLAGRSESRRLTYCCTGPVKSPAGPRCLRPCSR